MNTALTNRIPITLATLRARKAAGEKFAMLTAYDYPTAVLAERAGVDSLLVGDSLATVLLGEPNTRAAPLALMVPLAAAVRRGAPHVFLVGDLPYETLAGSMEVTCDAARDFVAVGCDAVKLEAGPDDTNRVAALATAGITTIAHLGLRPQQVLTPDGYRAQARDAPGIAALVAAAQRMVAAGAAMILLEAVPDEAAAAVVAGVPVPVIGCGAGAACDGHVVVTQDLLGLSLARPPRFVPVLAQLADTIEQALRQFVGDIAAGRYPGPQHMYSLRRDGARGPQ